MMDIIQNFLCILGFHDWRHHVNNRNYQKCYACLAERIVR
jgi:hypothetical protein